MKKYTLSIAALLLMASNSFAQIWKSGPEVLELLPEGFGYSTQCFETPPDIGGTTEVTGIDIECGYRLFPQNSHQPYCVTLYDTDGNLLEHLGELSTIELELEEPTIVVVGGHQFSSVENTLSLGIFYPLPEVEVENDCDDISFYVSTPWQLKINGENTNDNEVSFSIEGLTDFRQLEALHFEVEPVFEEGYNNLFCGNIQSVVYDYLPPAYRLSEDTLICEGAALKVTTLSHPTFEYRWSNGETDASVFLPSVPQDTNISLRVTDSIGCYIEADMLIETSFVDADLPEDRTITKGGIFTFCVPEDVNATYEWHNGSTSFCNTLDIKEDTQIWVKVQNSIGCQAADTMNIVLDFTPPPVEVQTPQHEEVMEKPKFKISCKEGVYIPNVIDLSSSVEVNRVFRVFTGHEIEQIAMAKVFDRQGSLLVEKQGLQQDQIIWEGTHKGKTVNNGVFAYWMIIETKHDEWLTCKGDLTVVGAKNIGQ